MKRKRDLDALVSQPAFQLLPRRGDTQEAGVPGGKRVKLEHAGRLTAAGEYLDGRVPLPRADPQPGSSYRRGNSWYIRLASGQEVKTRDARGNLTARGKELHTRPEVTIEIPAQQVGRNRSTGEEYRVRTTKVWTEEDHPEIGDVYRRVGGTEDQRAARVKQFVAGQLEDGE